MARNTCTASCLSLKKEKNVSFRYRDYRFPGGHHRQYEHNIFYWHVVAGKMAFIIVVEVSKIILD